MRKHILLAGLIAATSVAGSAAHAQSSVFKPRSESSQEMAIDVRQFSPEGQMSKLVAGMNQLLRENQELKAEIKATRKEMEETNGRLRALSNALTTGTGETIGSMVRKIRDRVEASE